MAGGIQPRVVSIGVALGHALADSLWPDLETQDGASELSVEGFSELGSGDANIALKALSRGGAQLADPLVLKHGQRRQEDQQGQGDERCP